MTPANAFETSVGHFWGIHSTRDYMRARFALADTVRQAGSLKAVEEGLGHFRDMLRLCRTDNLGVRNIIPALMLQLDQDQECYDFIKWYQTTGQRGDYDWGDMDMPFLDIVNADVLESLDWVPQKYADTSQISTLLLLKIKLLIDVLNVGLVRTVLTAKVLPPELWMGIEKAVVRSPLFMQLRQRGSIALGAMGSKLVEHIKLLGSVLRETNDSVMMGLLEPEEWLSTTPGFYSPGSVEEMQLVLRHSFAAWWETEGALELLQSARDIAAKDSADGIQDMMKGSTFKQNKGSSRSEAELLADVSLNRIWGYVDWAVEDAGSLRAERPSDNHMTRLRAMAREHEAEDRRLFGDYSTDSEGD